MRLAKNASTDIWFALGCTDRFLGQAPDAEQRGPRYAERQAEKDARFTKMDVDADGLVTYDQFLADGKHRFSIADLDKSGSVSMPEFFAKRWK